MEICHCPTPDPKWMAPSICDHCEHIIPAPAEVERFNQRTTSRPIGEHLTSGERARRAAVVVAVFPLLDTNDAFRIHEYMAGETDSLAGPWDGIKTVIVDQREVA